MDMIYFSHNPWGGGGGGQEVCRPVSCFTMSCAPLPASFNTFLTARLKHSSKWVCVINQESEFVIHPCRHLRRNWVMTSVSCWFLSVLGNHNQYEQGSYSWLKWTQTDGAFYKRLFPYPLFKNLACLFA